MNTLDRKILFPFTHSLWKGEEDVPFEKLSLGVPDPIFQAAKSWPKFHISVSGDEIKNKVQYADSGNGKENSIPWSTMNAHQNQTLDATIEKKALFVTDSPASMEDDKKELLIEPPALAEGSMGRKDAANKEKWNDVPQTDEPRKANVEQPLPDFSKNLLKAAINTHNPDEFISWLVRISDANLVGDGLVGDGLEKMETAPVKKKQPRTKKPKSEIEASIDSSIELGQQVISETLASLLVQQGHVDQAIDMFKKLALKYPEKGAIFAATIENLKS